MKTTEEPIVLKTKLNAPVSKVWGAITQIELMTQWYFEDIPDFQPEIGFTTKFSVQNGDRTFTHCWEVVDVVPEKLISYAWHYEEYEGDSNVSFELTEKEGFTHIKVVHKATKDFDADIPEFERENGLMGWDYFINDRLKAFVES